MDKTSNDPVRGNGHARAVQRLPARRVRDFSWPCSRVNLRGGAQKAAVARNRATFTWPCAATPCTRQVGPTSLGRGTVAGEGNDVHGPPALSPTVHRACESGAGGVVVRAPRTRAWCGKMAFVGDSGWLSQMSQIPPKSGAGGAVWLVSSLLSLRWPILQRQKHTTTTVRTHKVVPFRSVHVMGTPTVP